MYLKSLAIRGFKSFARKTILEFEPGVAIIVGPNGSGKSNIADAVAWVLGEQSPTSLRGNRMEDVIFAGSVSARPVSMAEVVLTLDNSNNDFPLDYSEVTISRNVVRGGDSEYRLNNSSCRLLDIQELLSDAGVGRMLNSVVGQGQIDEVLTCRPEERRDYIEEAGGLLKYRRRREKALRRLERLDDELVRTQDVMREVRRLLRPLDRQAGRLEDYKFLMREIGEAKLRLNVERLRTMQEEWQRHQGIQGERQEKLKGLEGRLSDRLAAARELEQGEGGWRTEEAALRDHLYRLVAFEEQLKALFNLWDEKQRIAAGILPAAADPDDLSRLRKRNSELEESKAELIGRSRKIYAQEAELAGRYQEINAELNDTIHEVLGLEARLEVLATPAGRLDSLVADRVRLRRERLVELEAERERLDSERDAISMATAAARIEEIKDELGYWIEAGVLDGEVGLDKGEMKARLSGLRGLEEKVTARLRKTENDLGEVRDDIKSVEAELAALNREMELGRQRELELQGVLDYSAAERPRAEGGTRLGPEEILLAKELHQNLIGQAQKRRELVLSRLDEGAVHVEGTADRLRSLRDGISGIQREREELRELMHGDDLAHAELKVRVEQLVEKIVDEHKVPLEFALKQCPEGEPEAELERNVEELAERLEHIGPVNPEAVTEKDSLEERHEFLREQVADIEQAKGELRKVVRQIDREIEGKFAQTLDDVNRNFQELFSFLFPKGRAEVRLTDPDDLLGSGVEILAQPEGKRLRRISLLSGGETALTAIAFFFALFRVRPSPFYFLDEVEAALDDVNLHRFLDLVREFKDESQLILITHQKRSMEIADVLYGITMQEDGISKVVSQRIAS